MRDLLLDALGSRNADRPPVWIMRQAGRYLPEYRALKERYKLKELMTNPELIVSVTKMPLARYDLDAAIIFSDILVAAAGLGLGWGFGEGSGPVIEGSLKTPEDIAALPVFSAEEVLPFVAEGIRAVVGEIDVPLIGFCGGPFTVACYLLEGGRTSPDVQVAKQWMWQHPQAFHALLEKITIFSIDYLKMQVAAGARAIQVFDSWAGLLPPTAFSEFVTPYLKRLTEAVDVPVILFCRGSGIYATELLQAGPAALSMDWNVDMPAMRAVIPQGVALQGNLDPCLLFADRNVLAREVQRLLEGMSGDPGFIFNLGHGVLPKTPVENVAFVVEQVKRFQTVSAL